MLLRPDRPKAPGSIPQNFRTPTQTRHRKNHRCSLPNNRKSSLGRHFSLNMLKRFGIIGLMNRLDAETRTTVLSCLLEGCSIRATVRMTGVSKKCVMRLLAEARAVAAKFQDAMLRELTCRRVQVDALWGFIYCKQINVTAKISNKHAAAGDVWLWTALDADSKLIISWRLGGRGAYDANVFIADRDVEGERAA